MASDRDDRRAAATALASLQRLADLGPALVLPAHGPLPAHPDAALQAAFRRAKRLVDDPGGPPSGTAPAASSPTPSTPPWTSEPSTFPVQRAGRDALR